MSARFTPPDNEAMVGPFAQCVRHPNATPLTYHGTNSWILAAPNDGACLVVDPGPDDAACTPSARKRWLTVVISSSPRAEGLICLATSTTLLG